MKAFICYPCQCNPSRITTITVQKKNSIKVNPRIVVDLEGLQVHSIRWKKSPTSSLGAQAFDKLMRHEQRGGRASYHQAISLSNWKKCICSVPSPRDEQGFTAQQQHTIVPRAVNHPRAARNQYLIWQNINKNVILTRDADYYMLLYAYLDFFSCWSWPQQVLFQATSQRMEKCGWHWLENFQMWLVQ